MTKEHQQQELGQENLLNIPRGYIHAVRSSCLEGNVDISPSVVLELGEFILNSDVEYVVEGIDDTWLK